MRGNQWLKLARIGKTQRRRTRTSTFPRSVMVLWLGVVWFYFLFLMAPTKIFLTWSLWIVETSSRKEWKVKITVWSEWYKSHCFCLNEQNPKLRHNFGFFHCFLAKPSSFYEKLWKFPVGGFIFPPLKSESWFICFLLFSLTCWRLHVKPKYPNIYTSKKWALSHFSLGNVNGIFFQRPTLLSFIENFTNPTIQMLVAMRFLDGFL